jgi:hypothetical protein
VQVVLAPENPPADTAEFCSPNVAPQIIAFILAPLADHVTPS